MMASKAGYATSKIFADHEKKKGRKEKKVQNRIQTSVETERESA